MNSMMGQIVNAHTVRLERQFTAPAEKVWNYFTDSELLGSWLMPCTIEREKDGLIEIVSKHDENGELEKEVPARGLISEYAPPKIFAFTWYEPDSVTASEFRVELLDRGEHVDLILTHSNLNSDVMAAVAAGWHTHLDTLLAIIQGHERPDFFLTFNKLLEEYKVILAGAGVVVVASTGTPVMASEVSDETYSRIRVQKHELLVKYNSLWMDAKVLNDDIARLERATNRDEKSLDSLHRDLKYKKQDMHKIELDIRDLDKVLH